MKKSSLTKILIDWVRLFHDINLKHNGVIVIPRFSTVCGSVLTSFGDIGEKFTLGSAKDKHFSSFHCSGQLGLRIPCYGNMKLVQKD